MYTRSSSGLAEEVTTREVRQPWNASRKWFRRASSCCFSGGAIDHEVGEARGVIWLSVGGGDRQWRVKAGKSRDNGS